MRRINLARLGGRIRRHRKRLKLTQQALATMLGAESRTTAWEWEHGVRAPTTEQLITMAKLFGIKFAELVPEAEDSEEEASEEEASEEEASEIKAAG